MSRKRVLFVTARPPYPLDTGAKIRTWNILAGYADRHDADVLHFRDAGPQDEWETAASGLGVNQVTGVTNPAINRSVTLTQFASAVLKGLPISSVKYINDEFSRTLRDLVAMGYDIVHIDTIHLAVDLDGLMQIAPDSVFILNAHNVEAQIAERMRDLEKSLPRKAALAIHARNMRSFEERAFAAADIVLAVSDEDRVQIDAMAGSKRGLLVENGVDDGFYTPGDPGDERADELVFVGSMDWLPNVDGMKWFVAAMLPRIRAERPKAHISIVGRSPHPDIAALHDPDAGVTVTGTVDDVRPFVRRASVVVVPLRFGGGTRLKILEAFSMGKCVLSSSLGCEGIQCRDGIHIRIEDEPAAFAKACLALMEDADTRRELGANGRELALATYAWKAVVGRMHEAVAVHPKLAGKANE